jgi:uncharacterized metal-binding protein
MVRVINELESCRLQSELLTNRLGECDLLLKRVISDRNEAINVLARSEQINVEIRQENAKLNNHIIRLRRQRWWFFGSGFVVGAVSGWFTHKLVK